MNEIFLNQCRACAGLHENSIKMISLLSEENISEMFTNCTSLEIASHDGLPSHICFECFGHLSNFDKFRQSCLNLDKSFREQLVTESFKTETFDEICIKEEYEPISNIYSEFQESKLIDEDFSNNDSDSNAPIKSTEDNVSYGDRDSYDNNAATTTGGDIDIDLDLFDRTKYICDFCGQQFKQRNFIAGHIKRHIIKTKQLELNFPCTVNGCVKRFTKKQSLYNHQKNIHKITPKPCAKLSKLRCEQCPKQFVIPVKLDAHIRQEHEGLKPYKCAQCDKEFCRFRSYKRHLRFSHTNDGRKMYACTIDGCDNKYLLQDSLRVHINRIHLGIIPAKRQNLICEHCGRTFTCAVSLKKHSYTHSGNLPFACKMCPKKFKSNDKLKIHTRRHLNVKPFVCPICGERKTTTKELNTHMNFHTKEKTYPCKECAKVFSNYAAMNRHDRIHHRKLKPYVCPHCQQTFAQADTLKNHVMTHTGEKPYACSLCGHRFIQSVALRSHMKVHDKKSI